MDFKDLVKRVKRYNKDSDIVLIEKAYVYAKNLLKEKFRLSGNSLLEHQLEVAYEVLNLKLDDKSIAAALLHGLLNKGANIKDLKKEIDEEVLSILENIEKMSEIKRNISKQVSENENLKKVLLVASKDIRALIIKICDKVVNLRDLQFLNQTERKRIANEALNVYAPLAYRLGMGKIKSEIEDLAFKNLDEKSYNAIKFEVENIRKQGEIFLYKFEEFLKKELKKEGIDSIVQSRIKHIYSIHKKILAKSYDLGNLRDIIGFRVIVKNVDDCYNVLKIVHNNFRSIPSGFKDYIAMPKPNGYQSLHISVAGQDGRIFEIQIRTEEMHEFSEEGIAAHFNYKKISHGKKLDTKIQLLKQLVGNKELLPNFDLDLFGDQIFVFTPKGKIIELPKSATVIDFAYYVHSDLGDHCTGANVNGKFMSLKDKLENGDIVNILTIKNQKPSREWLKFAQTSKARSKIKHSLKESGKITARTSFVHEDVKKEIGESLLIVEGDKRLKTKLALCCKPTPGDKIVGIKINNLRATIHKISCESLSKAEKKKVKVFWIEKFKEPVKIIVDAKDRPGIFKEIINAVARLEIKINGTKVKFIGDGIIECRFTANVYELKELNGLINKIKKIKDINHVYLNL